MSDQGGAAGEEGRELRWLRRVRDLSHQLASESEVERVVPRILDAAVELAGAERGFLVLVEGPPGAPTLHVVRARGFDREELSGPEGKISRTVVERVRETRRGLVSTREEDRGVLGVSSLQERRVLSVACVPLLSRGELLGVLYLDHRFLPEAFREEDLEPLQAFAEQAALALETARLLQEAQAGAPGLGELVRLRRAREARGEAPAGGELRVSAQPSPLRFGALVGGSEVMQALGEEVERGARTRAPVLILGESGSGKELVARELHARGPDPGAPFLRVSCAALPEGLLESELFGHVRGAFTGASRDRTGLFTQADRGTLLLDEVGETSPAVQAKLLRALEEGQVRPLGGTAPVPVRCRVIATSQHDLRRRVEEGSFRRDLYYRLDVLRILVPPLRERPGDLPLLLLELLREAGAAPGVEVSAAAVARLQAHAWPGNVRELQNEARRLAALGLARIGPRDLSPEVRGDAPPPPGPEPWAGKTLAEVEREVVAAALEKSGGNKAAAARRLGVPKTSFYHLVARYRLE